MAQDGAASMISSPATKRFRAEEENSSVSGAQVLPPPTFDLDVWAGNYSGPILPHRLAHIALRCKALQQQALALAIDAVKKGKNAQEYVQLCDAAANMGYTDLAVKDEAWVTRQEDSNKREYGRLESELRGYRNNLIKESIRMGQEDLANHHLLTGGPRPDTLDKSSQSVSGLQAAYTAFSKMREYASMPTHMASMNLNLLITSIVQAVQAQTHDSIATTYWNQVVQNAHRLRSSGVKEEDQSKLTPLANVASGIAHVGLGHYKDAAAAFLAVPVSFKEDGDVYGRDFKRWIASPNDVAIYGGLCALATMSRDELQAQVLGGPFRSFLEEEPHMRKAISLFTTAKYQSCLTTLRHYYSDWNLDIYLGAQSRGLSGTHVDLLLGRIRKKSITAYFSSFTEVSLQSLAWTFPPLISSNDPNAQAIALEAEVCSMIESGMLAARLDVVEDKIVAPSADARATAHARAAAAAEEVEKSLLLRLQKVNAAIVGLETKRPPSGASGWGKAGSSEAAVSNGTAGFSKW